MIRETMNTWSVSEASSTTTQYVVLAASDGASEGAVNKRSYMLAKDRWRVAHREAYKRHQNGRSGFVIIRVRPNRYNRSMRILLGVCLDLNRGNGVPAAVRARRERHRLNVIFGSRDPWCRKLW